jgi:hypothetical protein
MRAMDDTIQDRIGDGRIAKVLVPAVGGQLTRDDRGPRAVAIVEDLQEVLALDVFETGDSPIIEDQHIHAGEPGEQGREVPSPCASVSSGNRRGMRR